MANLSEPDNSKRAKAPRWIKLFIGVVIVLATFQLVRDLGASGIGLHTLGNGLQVFGNSGIASQVLGAGTASLADIPIRLKEVQTPRDRCQNKLGLHYGFASRGERFTVDDLWIHEYMLRTMYRSGMRYAMINVETRTDTDALNVAEFVELSYKNYLIPIVQIGTVDNDQWGSYLSNADWYKTVLEALDQDDNVRGNTNFDDERGLDIIATTAPRYLLDRGEYANAVGVAINTSGFLQEEHNLIIATPVMRTYEGTRNLGYDYDYELTPDTNDEVFAMSQNNLDFQIFDKVLVSVKNFDDNWGVTPSIYDKRGYSFYENEGDEGQYVRARGLINDFNATHGLNLRSIIVDYGPSASTRDINPTRLKERLMYDFAKFSDDPTVDGVVFSQDVTELLLGMPFDQVPEPEEEEDDTPTVPLDSCPVGENTASTAGAGSANASRIAEIGYGSALVIINGPGDVGAAINDSIALCNAGVTPIIRSCITGLCGFNNGGEQAAALNQIINNGGVASACGGGDPGLYAVCGHNEPISEHPFTFEGIVNNDAELTRLFTDEAINFAAPCAASVSRPSWVAVTSPIFNGTQPKVNLATQTFRNAYPRSLTSDFVCMATNVYDVPGRTAASFYSEFIGNFSGMPGCVMETGHITNTSPITASSDPSQAANTVQDLLSAGAINVLGFNFMGLNPGWSTFALADQGELLIQEICGGGAPSNPSEDNRYAAIYDFFSDINVAGTNCNYDLVDFGQEYEERSIAEQCGIKNGSTGSKLARTKITCNASGVCSGNATFTLQVGLPIAGAASNSAVGERTYPLPSFAVEAARRGNDITTDYLNQNAGRLTGDGITYAMPWLGSLIDSTGEGTKSYFYNGVGYEQQLSAGASVLQSRLENADGDFAIRGYQYGEDNWTFLPDEHTTCVGNFCVRTQDYIEAVDGFRVYDPTKTANIYEQSRMCGGGAIRTKNDPDNMIFGSEIELEVETWSGTAEQLCYEAWLPDADGDISVVREITGENIQCRDFLRFANKPQPAPDPNLQGPNNPCRCAERQVADDPLTPFINEEVFYQYNEANVRAGLCTAGASVIQACTEYVPGESQAASYFESVAFIDHPWPRFPSLDVEGAYDALAGIYKTVQDKMSSLGLKLILPEGIGWRGEQVIRAYATVPTDDFMVDPISGGHRNNNMLNNTFEGGTIPQEEDYLTTYTRYFAETAEVALLHEPLIEGALIEAPGISNERLDYTHTASTYYEMLGYIDILNQINHTFFTESGLLGGQLNEQGEYIESLANALTSQIPGCEGPISRRIGFPINCIAPYAPPTSDLYRPDPLGVFLCEQGYESGEDCEDLPGTEEEVPECRIELTGDVTCPVVGGNCLYGPNVSSHSSINAVDLVSGTVVVAPFDGIITRAERAEEGFDYCAVDGQVAGDAIWFTGNVGGRDITLWFYHAVVTDEVLSRVNGEPYEAGEQITVTSTRENDYIVTPACGGGARSCWCGRHLHVELRTPTGGSALGGDIAGLMQDLGCGIYANSPYPASCERTSDDDLGVEPGEVGDLECRETGGTGLLACEIDMEDTTDQVRWDSIGSWVNRYVEAYNIDQAQFPSRTWIGNESIVESPELRASLEANWGGAAGADQERAERIRVTNAVIEHAVEVGLNPHFIMTLWIEETGASAVGQRNLGCIWFRDGTRTRAIELGASADTMIDLLREQVDCVRSYVDDFPDFTQFMCTYSGEEGRPNCTAFRNNPNFPRNVCRYYSYLEGDFTATGIPEEGTDSGDASSECVVEGVTDCPVVSPVRISQASSRSGGTGSHAEASILDQQPTDITGIANTGIRAVVAGRVELIRDPIETFNAFDEDDLCHGVRLPNGDLYYDGGFVVHIRGTDGRLYRYVHLENLNVREGQQVAANAIIGQMFDGRLEDDEGDGRSWTGYNGAGGCWGASHLHFAIIDSDVAGNPANGTYPGNDIDSTPCVRQWCGL